MKKLLDETTDDLTRALLEAGRSQRPPPGNQAKVLVALGVGAGVGLFSAKASAWLGTGAGKLTLLGVGLSIAGSVWLALPASEPVRVAGRLSPVAADSALEAVPSPADAVPAVVPSALLEPQPAFVPARVAAAPSDPSGSSLAGSPVSNAVPARHANAPVAVEWRRRVAGARKRTAMRRGDVSQRPESNSDGPLPAVPAALPAVGALSPAALSPAALSPAALSSAALSSAALSPATAGTPSAASLPPDALASAAPSSTVQAGAGLDAPLARASGLDAEIQIVDAMRGAAQRNDSAALQRLVESYRGTFPEGQLRQEVSELARRGRLPAR